MLYIISDIHANIFALEAVMNDIPKDAIILCAGDIVGYYSEPNEVCDLLRDRNVECIKGNHDSYVLGLLPFNLNNDEKYRVELTQQLLTPKNKDWLLSLPEHRVLNFDSEGQQVIIHLNHGSLHSSEHYLYPDANINFDEPDIYTLYIFGHTHHPMVKKFNNHVVLNPGSVGQPRDWNPGASYASFSPFSREVRLHRVEYDLIKYQEILSKNNISKDMINILSRKK